MNCDVKCPVTQCSCVMARGCVKNGLCQKGVVSKGAWGEQLSGGETVADGEECRYWVEWAPLPSPGRK